MISKKDIINEIAKDKLVEKLIKRYPEFKNNPYIWDLIQDIYVSLMEKESIFIQNLYKKNELEFFIVKMIKNNLYSNTSPFYYKYQRFYKFLDEKYEEE